MLSREQKTQWQINTKETTNVLQVFRYKWAAVSLCPLEFQCVSHLSLCLCLNAEDGQKADEDYSKLTHIEVYLGLCSAVSATGDILSSEPFMPLNAQCELNLLSTQQVWRGQIRTGGYRDRGSRWKLASSQPSNMRIFHQKGNNRITIMILFATHLKHSRNLLPSCL